MTTQTPDAVREAVNALDRFVIDQVGNDDTIEGMEVDRQAQNAVATLRTFLAALDSRAGDAEPKNPMRKVQATGKFKGRAGRYCSLSATLECGHTITATGEVACSDLRYAKRRACSECGDIARQEWMNNRYEATPAPTINSASDPGEGAEERPFAHCCAEAGGRIEACDCANKNHGTAWFSTPASHASDGGKA